MKMPPYPGVSQVMEISKVEDWQEQYAAYLAEKEAKEFNDCEKETPGHLTAQDGEEWAIEYYKYLAEKEKALEDNST